MKSTQETTVHMVASKYFVLVVDSDCHRGRLLVSQLTNARCYAARAHRGEEALQFVRDHAPDAVICDWHLEDMSGLELLRRIKEESFQTKVILASEHADWQLLRQTLASGGEDLLGRPFSIVHLLCMLGRSLEWARPGRPAVHPSTLVLAGP